MATTIELYEALVAAGVEDRKAKAATEAVLSREEAVAILATQDDIKDVRKELHDGFVKIIMWVAGMLIGQIAVMSGIIALMLNYFV